jgi:tetratricopeptide (TPR) repeat protein
MALRTLFILILFSSVLAGSAQDSVRYYIHRGTTMAKLGDYPAAVKNLDRAIELDSLKAEAWYNRGLVRIETGDYPAAIGDLTRAVRIKQGYPEPWRRRKPAT